MKTLRNVKWINPKDLKEDINTFENLIDNYINGKIGSLMFMMHTQTMITRVTRITENGARVAEMRHLQYKLDKLIAADKELDTDTDELRLKVRDIADEVIENMYAEYVRDHVR